MAKLTAKQQQIYDYILGDPANYVTYYVGYLEMMELKKEGESGREKMNQYTRYLTVLICMIQAYGIAVVLEHLAGHDGVSAVINPGYLEQ